MSEYFSKKLIRNVWDRSRDAKRSTAGAPGVDGISALDFKRNLDENIDLIYQQIKTKDFHFKKLRLVKLPKGDDSFRIIAIPTVRDRLVQRVVLHYFTGKPKLSPATEISYGSVSGRGVNSALKAAIKFRNEASIVLQTDITKFFDTIDRSKLKRAIPTTICKSVREIISKAIDCEIMPGDNEDAAVLHKNGIVT